MALHLHQQAAVYLFLTTEHLKWMIRSCFRTAKCLGPYSETVLSVTYTARCHSITYRTYSTMDQGQVGNQHYATVGSKHKCCLCHSEKSCFQAKKGQKSLCLLAAQQNEWNRKTAENRNSTVLYGITNMTEGEYESNKQRLSDEHAHQQMQLT